MKRKEKKWRKNLAIQALIPSNKQNSIEIHFGITPKGYAWISSYNGITNIGFTDVFTELRNYGQLLMDFAKQQGFIIQS